MDNLAREPDKVMARIARSGAQGDCGPKLNDEIDAKTWLARPGSPKAELANGKPQGETVDCDRLLQAWREGRAAPSKAAILCSPDKNEGQYIIFRGLGLGLRQTGPWSREKWYTVPNFYAAGKEWQ
ncbi:MAG: hypothetical protein IH900_02680 [Proteobacteria bacterium]|nr:hypothetical protein [Pseudomonadota bacterium]